MLSSASWANLNPCRETSHADSNRRYTKPSSCILPWLTSAHSCHSLYLCDQFVMAHTVKIFIAPAASNFAGSPSRGVNIRGYTHKMDVDNLCVPKGKLSTHLRSSVTRSTPALSPASAPVVGRSRPQSRAALMLREL